VFLPQSGASSSSEIIKQENSAPAEMVSVSNQAAKKKAPADPLALPVTATVVAAASAASLQQAVVISTAIAEKARPATKILSAANKPPAPKTVNNLMVPLTTSMLLEMANGMDIDPEANLKLV
jgi:hypothetical protein